MPRQNRAVVEGALARQERAEAWAALQEYYKDAQGPLSQTEWDAIQELYTLWDFGASPGERISGKNTNSRLRKGNLSQRWGYPRQRAFAVTAPVPGGSFLRREVGTLESRSRERAGVYDQAMRKWNEIKDSPRNWQIFGPILLSIRPSYRFQNRPRSLYVVRAHASDLYIGTKRRASDVRSEAAHVVPVGSLVSVGHMGVFG